MIRFNDKEYTGQDMFTWLKMAKDLEAQGKDIIHLEIGDLDFPTPRIAVEKCIAEIENGNTHYVPSRGCKNLIDAAIFVTERSRKFRPDETQVLVTPGANIQIYLGLACVCNGGDEVIIIAPYFPSYISQIKAIGALPVIVGTDEAFHIDVEKIARAITPRTKALIINSPNNPSGAVYSENRLNAVYDIARKNDLLFVSDEVYSRTVFDRKFYSVAMRDHCRDNVLVVNGFSKSHAMTGWRLGVATGPAELIEKMRILQEAILSCVPPFIQEAGAELLMHEQAEQAQMTEVIRVRRNALYHGIKKTVLSLDPYWPEGGLYCWCKIKNSMTADQYCRAAMNIGVAIAPGTMFGVEGYVRLAYVKPVEQIITAIERLAIL